MPASQRRTARDIAAALTNVERLHGSPADAADDHLDWLADVDELSAIIVGGLRSGGVTTNAVNQGLVCLQAILTTHDQMNPEQRAALMRLEQALREA